MPRGRNPRSRYPNLRSRRIIYMQQEDIFRFIEENPSVCVQYVTFTERQETFCEDCPQMPGMQTPEFMDMLSFEIMQHELSTVRTVAYYNCLGYEQGERRSN